VETDREVEDTGETARDKEVTTTIGHNTLSSDKLTNYGDNLTIEILASIF